MKKKDQEILFQAWDVILLVCFDLLILQKSKQTAVRDLCVSRLRNLSIELDGFREIHVSSYNKAKWQAVLDASTLLLAAAHGLENLDPAAQTTADVYWIIRNIEHARGRLNAGLLSSE